jgi:drug/metabolite transporter (DMT)-like permease
MRDIAIAELEVSTWQLLIVLGLGSTLLPFAATLYASRHTTASRVALTGYVAPLVGVVGGWLLLDEVITATLLVGGVLTLVGVALATSARRRPAVDAIG